MDFPYQQYFEALPCYVTVQDRDLKVIAGNHRFRQAFGEYHGRYCYQIFKQQPERCEVCPVEKTFHDGQGHSSEQQLKLLDGTEMSVIVYTEPIRNEAGEITSVMKMLTDITGIKRLQEQLRESQMRYRSLFEEVPCYISIQDEDLNIVDANRLHRQDFGTFLGCKCYEVYRHRTEECYPCCVRDTFADGKPRIHEDSVASRRGEAMDLLIHTSPIFDASGRIKYVMEMSDNITEIRRLESQLTSIGLLISSISHGIKGLLNSLNGGIYLVNSGLGNNNRSRLTQGWEIVMRNVGRIRSMVLDILYYAKDREPNYEQLSSEATIAEVYDLMSEKARELNIDLRKETDAGAGVFEGDAKAIRALLVNLLENSLDACRVDSHKHSHQVTLRAMGGQDGVRFEIEDNGKGMDRETREKVFSLFFSSKGTEGTGLGLFIANKIAGAHGGSIDLESEPNAGAKFTVSIPRRRPAQRPHLECVEQSQPCGSSPVPPLRATGGHDEPKEKNPDHR
jgi:PAS domain S-box-containing protein